MILFDLRDSFYIPMGACQKTREYIRRSVPSTHKYLSDAHNEMAVHVKYIVAVTQIEITHSDENVDYSALPHWARAELEEYEANKQRLAPKSVVLSGKSSAYSILYLIPDAPGYIVDAAYKALVKVHHPDVGGDEETFKNITTAYAKIKGR